MTVYKDNKTEKQYTKTAKKAVTNPIVKKAIAKKSFLDHVKDSAKDNDELYQLLAK